MRHDQFAEQVARKLEDTAEAIDEDELPMGGGITAMRANELRVAACVVRDLSQVATREEEKGSLEEHLPPEIGYSEKWIVEGRAKRKEQRVANSRNRDEGQGPKDRAKGGAEAKDTPTSSEKDDRDEGRSSRDKRMQEEKKAASPGPSGS